MTKQTFTQLVLESEQMLYRISMSMLKNESDCQDAIQTAILTAFEKLGTLKKEEYFKTWLVRILINTCNKQLNAKKKQAEINENITVSTSSQEEVEVQLALEALPQKIRHVVVLYYIEQFTTKEISSILKIPKGTVLSRLSKGRELLKLELL